ncbi:MAG: PKD domain-containing protein, partial [Crocinitomicaceae bacterium]
MNIFNLTSLKSIGLSFGLLVGTVVSAQQNPDVENNLNRIEDPVHHSHSGNLAEGEKEFFNFVNSKPNFNDSYEAARFIENKGQWNSNVLFRTELVDGAIFFEKNKLKYQFVDGNGFYDALHGGESEYTIKTHALEVDFVNASDEVKISRAVSFAQHNQSYFYGNGKQASNVKFYQEVTYENLYEGITVVYHSFNDHLKYDVRVAQGADPNQFVMNYDGAEHIFIDENGNLIIETTLSGIAEFAPYTYQIINGVETKVESRYVLNGTEVSFEFPNGYDTNEELIIDPSLVASTYTGSTSDNWGFTAGHTAGGEMVVAGAASGAGYPTTIGAFQTTWNGATTFPTGGLAADITVSIFSADGTTLISSSYLGGTNFETAHSLQVDQLTGDVYILGKTRSTDFPTTITAFDQTHNGGTSDIFITRLNSTLSVLTASTFVGGSGVDGANVDENFAGTANTKFSYGDAHRGQIVFDSAGDLYVVSSTQSTDFPTSVGALDATLGGTQDVVVFKMDNLLTGLIYSTYLGGTAIDAGMGIAVDPSGNAYVTGATEGGGFPATAGTIDNTYNGNVDGFLTLLNATGTANTATTFLGTTAKDGGFYVDLDEANDPVVFGLSLGGTYPTTVGVYTDANSRQFVHGLSADLTTTNFSTIYGTSSGTPSINPTGFQVDSCGKIICGGWGRSFDGSTSTGLVTTGGAYQTTTDGSDFHFAVLGVNATSLVYATFVGENGGVGDHVDGGSSTFDDKGIIYQAVCASCGGTNGFPTTAGASSSTNNAANCNNAVFKFDLDTYAPNAAGIAAVGVGCLGIPVTFTNTSGGAVSYEWNFGDGSPVSTATNPSHTYTATGTYTVQLVAFNPTACITSDTTSITIDIDQPNVTVSTNPASGTICNGDNVTMTAAGANTYTWTPGPFTGNPYVQSPTTTTTYEVIGADANGCEDTVQVTITVDPVPTGANAGTDQTVCETPGTATLAGNTPVTGTGIWTLTSGTGTITTPSSPTSGVTGLGVGANVFSWTITNGVCAASSDDVTINVDADATIADAGTDQTQCETITTATLSGNTPTSGTGVWTVIAGGATITTPASPTSGVTGLTAGTNTFEWTITNGTCTPTTDQITITLDAAPTAANAGTDQTVCETPGTATLAGNTPVTGTGTWTLTSGTGTITTPSSPTSGLTGLGVGANVFTWTTSNGTCPTSSDDVTINVDADATIADAGADQDICVDNTTLAGNIATSGTGVWTLVSGSGTITTPSSPTSGVTGLGAGANVFEWTITNGTCAPSTDQVTINVTPDTDGDLVCDGVDEDDDNDGIPDVAENPGDSDGDGIPDSLDLDSDNDGIPDIIEAGGTDADGDGEVDYPVPGDPSSMTDVDGDGVDDNVDPSEGGTALPNPDSDGDGVNDATDLDADNDGTPDIVEAGGTDADGDGQVDGYTDVDGDGFADINDTDDNTVPGTGDGGTPLANPDSDNDGV